MLSAENKTNLLAGCISSLLLEEARQKLTERQVDAALRLFYHADVAGEDSAACAAGRWECFMLLGDFEAAWQESAAIERMEHADPNRFWDGSSFQGKRVMVRCLHGYGDAIQFIRYIPQLRQQAAEVIVETHPEMVCLLRNAEGVDRVICWGDEAPKQLPKWDAQIEIMELPRAFRTSLTTIPAQVPYFRMNIPERRKFLENAGYPYSAKTKRIGIIWRSSAWNPLRTIPLQDWLPLFKEPGCAFYSLQWEPTEEECSRMEKNQIRVPNSWKTMEEFSWTLSSMDLILTVDTMAAHLAGALALPVWTFLPFCADWRWMLNREDSPWYPTMRLIRQRQPGDWGHAVQAVQNALPEFCRLNEASGNDARP